VKPPSLLRVSKGLSKGVLRTFGEVTFVLLVTAVLLTIFGTPYEYNISVAEDLDELRGGLQTFPARSSEFNILLRS